MNSCLHISFKTFKPKETEAAELVLSGGNSTYFANVQVELLGFELCSTVLRQNSTLSWISNDEPLTSTDMDQRRWEVNLPQETMRAHTQES